MHLWGVARKIGGSTDMYKISRETRVHVSPSVNESLAPSDAPATAALVASASGMLKPGAVPRVPYPRQEAEAEEEKH